MSVTNETNPPRQRGDRIRALRKEAGLSVRELAERASLHPQSLRNIELERRPASSSALESIAAALGVPVAEITRDSGAQDRPRLRLVESRPAAEPAPPYRLYTSKEAAERIGGGITESLLRRLARSGEVEYTLIGRKVRWTDEQLWAAVRHHATTGNRRRGRTSDEGAAEAASAARARRARRSVPRRQQAGQVLTPSPGRRYRTA